MSSTMAISPPSPPTAVFLAMAIVVVVGPGDVLCQKEEEREQKGCGSGHMPFGGKCEPIRGHGEPCAGKKNSVTLTCENVA